ncbi:MFS transporter [Schaalia sp. lx-100]|uniref:MFS transporter n=1 Tax=Schaalia sp. lx-100 TaxID=2899081 RepID=UPI001E4BE322|nr:MFS transporter [Schaalia sp. lx-100]
MHNLDSTYTARRAAIGCLAVFATLGFVIATWLSRLPAVRDALELSPARIGTLLLIGSFGSLIALALTGPLIGRYGPRQIVRAGVSVWACGMSLVASAVAIHSENLISVGLVILSCGISMWGAAMNVEGGYIEKALKRSFLPKLHALFSFGTVCGAAAGAGLVHLGIPVVMHLVANVCIGLVTVWGMSSFWILMTDISPHESQITTAQETDKTPLKTPALTAAHSRAQVSQGKVRYAWKEKTTVCISIMVLCAGLMEGAANDWLALSMIDGYEFSEGKASLTLAFFLLTMMTVRLSSEKLHIRFGVAPLLRVLLLLACGGLLLVAAAPHWGLAMIGVTLWAIGAALIYPSAASALSQDPYMTAARLSVLSTINYGAFLIGPPVLGWIAEHIGYAQAMAFLVPSVLIGMLFTRWLPDGARITGKNV